MTSTDTDTDTDRIVPFRAGGPSTAAIAPHLITSGPHVLLTDISEFQPDLNDALYLATFAKAAIIRAAYGDAHADRAWYGGDRRSLLHAAGCRWLGIYQYIVATQDVTAQAKALVRLLGSMRPGEKIIADLEEGSGNQHARWAAFASVIHSELGDTPWNYSGRYYAAEHGLAPVDWIADYGSTEPHEPHKLWQFTDRYNIPGVGVADCSIWHGTIDQLAATAWHQSKPAPVPPANWTYGAPQNLRATGGHTSVALTWTPPAGAPVAPDHYAVYLYEGTTTSQATSVPTYPRTATSSPWQGGGLKHGQRYTAHVVACGPGSTHIKPGTYASVEFTTG